MARRLLLVLFTALGTACAGAAGFSEAPHEAQLVTLALACSFVVAHEMISTSWIQNIKKPLKRANAIACEVAGVTSSAHQRSGRPDVFWPWTFHSQVRCGRCTNLALMLSRPR